jgi:hypothetical protein
LSLERRRAARLLRAASVPSTRRLFRRWDAPLAGSWIMTSAPTPAALPSPIASTTSTRIAAPWLSVFPSTRPPLPLMPSPSGGIRKVPDTTAARARFSFSPTGAVATVVAVMPGKPNSSFNWLTRFLWLSRSLTTPPAPPNGTLSNIVSSLPSRETGPVNPWIPTRRFSTTFAPPGRKLAGHRLLGSSLLPLRRQAHPRTTRCSALEASRDTARVELHHQAATVKLFCAGPKRWKVQHIQKRAPPEPSSVR